MVSGELSAFRLSSHQAYCVPTTRRLLAGKLASIISRRGRPYRHLKSNEITPMHRACRIHCKFREFSRALKDGETPRIGSRQLHLRGTLRGDRNRRQDMLLRFKPSRRLQILMSRIPLSGYRFKITGNMKSVIACWSMYRSAGRRNINVMTLLMTFFW
jgi:hypothetical protein